MLYKCRHELERPRKFSCTNHRKIHDICYSIWRNLCWDREYLVVDALRGDDKQNVGGNGKDRVIVAPQRDNKDEPAKGGDPVLWLAG